MSNIQPLKTIFMGTPEFAIPGFKALANDSRFDVVLAITQTDKAVGRRHEVKETPIKQTAKQLDIDVLQPAKIKDAIDKIKEIDPDLIVVIAYGKIIPQSILDIPKYGCINLHGSLLPKYRGASCLSAPILNGDKESGLSVMKMDAGLDTGPVIRQASVKLEDKETLSSLHDKLSQLGANLLPDAIIDYINGEEPLKEQDDSLSSYVKMTSKQDGEIDWNKSAQEIERQVRAYNPWPGTFSYLPDGKMLKIIEADYTNKEEKNAKVGEIMINDDEISIRCGQGSLIILQLQLEGGKKMDAKQFIVGNSRLNAQILASSSIG